MNARERILTIRLIDRIIANPARAEALGIVIVNDVVDSDLYRVGFEEADSF